MEGKRRLQRISYEESRAWLQAFVEEAETADARLLWDREKQKLTFHDAAGVLIWRFRFPLPFPLPIKGESLEDYASRIPEDPDPFLLILIQAGHSALGFFEEGELELHKVIKKYMVRRKHGKAQIGHLAGKGKSKAGSRIRLANTVSFFEDINTKITEWNCIDECERILISCPIRMLPLLYSSKVPPPFEKDDPRLIKVPLDVQRPDQKEMERVQKLVHMGEVEGNLPEIA